MALKQLPRDPMELQSRMMAAIIGDIREPGATTFARLDALRAVTKLEQPANEESNHDER